MSPPAGLVKTTQRCVRVPSTLVLFLKATPCGSSWSPLVYKVADLNHGPTGTSTMPTFSLPCVVHATQGINTCTRCTPEDFWEEHSGGALGKAARGCVPGKAGLVAPTRSGVQEWHWW